MVNAVKLLSVRISHVRTVDSVLVLIHATVLALAMKDLAAISISMSAHIMATAQSTATLSPLAPTLLVLMSAVHALLVTLALAT